MTVLLFEPANEGHRLHFVGLIAAALQEHRIPFVWALPEQALDSPDAQTHLGEGRWNHRLIVLPNETGATNPSYAWARSLGTTLRDSPAKHVLLPTADGLGQALAFRSLPAGFRTGDRHLHALLMRVTAAYPIRNPVWKARSILSWNLVNRIPWSNLFMLDPIGFRYASRSLSARLLEHCGLMPEPIEEIAPLGMREARESLGIPGHGRIIGCAGRIDRRKGVDRLIRAFGETSLRPDDRLLLVGRHEPAIRKLLRGPYSSLVDSGRIIARDTFADRLTFERVFQASDVVAVPYPRHIGSSGILLRAVRCGKPVLASDWGWIGWVTRRFGLGTTADIRNQAAFSSALAVSLETADNYRPGADTERLMNFHSVQNFQAHWLNAILKIDRPEKVLPTVSWASVLGDSETSLSGAS